MKDYLIYVIKKNAPAKAGGIEDWNKNNSTDIDTFLDFYISDVKRTILMLST